MTGSVIIYTLSDPRTGEVRYVGKSSNLRARLTAHINDSSSSHKSNWISSLKSIGLRPKMEEIESLICDSDAEWQDAERYWISTLRFLGCKLTNLDPGGIGGGKRSPETGLKISASLTGKRLSKDHISKLRACHLGVKLSQATRLKMSIRMRNLSELDRKKISDGMIGRKHSESTLKKLSKKARVRGDALRGVAFSEETRSRMAVSQKARRNREKEQKN